MRPLTTTVVLCTLAASVLTSAAPAARAQSTVLGIDCDRPRPNSWGLVVEATDFQVARCEADRAKALNWAKVVIESSKRLHWALSTLPPPLQDGLVAHMDSDDDLDDWTWSDPGVETLLTSLAGRNSYLFQPPLDAAQSYGSGILAGSTLNPVWHDDVQARFCGDVATRRGRILVWMDEATISGNDRWTPEMVRRVQRDQNRRRHTKRETLGKVIDTAAPGNPAALVYVGENNRETPLTDPCWAGINTGTDGVIAYYFGSPTHPGHLYDARQACPVATDVGYRLVKALRRNGVWIRPEDGIDDPDGVTAGLTRAPGAGGIIDAVDVNEAWQLVEDECRPGVTFVSERTTPCTGAGEDGVQIERFFYREVRVDDPRWRPVTGTAVRVIPINLSPGAVVTPHPTLPNAFNISGGSVTPATSVHTGRVTSATCNDPSTPTWDLTPDEVTCTALYGHRWCPDEHGAAAPYGLRRCWLREISEGWAGPTFDVQVRTVTDHCFDLTRATGSQSRTGSECEVVPTTTATTTGSTSYLSTVHNDVQVPDPDWVAPSPCNTPEDPANPNDARCGETAPLVTQTVATTTTETHTETGTDQGPCDCPAGWTGSIVQERDFRWHDRDWAVRATNPSGRFALDLIASWFDAAHQHAPGEARVYSDMRSELEGRQSDWLEPAQTARDFGPEVYTVWLEQDWHEESSTCSPPVPNSGGGGPTSWLAPDGETYQFWSPEADHQIDLPPDNIGWYDPDDDGGR